MNEVPVTFRINTNAEVTSNPEAIAISFKVIMRVPIKTLLRSGMKSLNACEQFTCTLKQNSDKAKEETFVVKDLHILSVGFTAFNALNLVAKVCDMTITKEVY